MSSVRILAPELVRADRLPSCWIAGSLRAAGPSLLFGLRLWAAVSLALFVAFRLELDNAYWAGTSAAIVCQPSLGASLRKASFRMIGTLVGAITSVVLAACFPQERIGFLLGLAALGAACGFVAAILRNFASYGAALAGATAVIIASDIFGPTGGVNGDIFTLALARVSEICIGIVCAGIVLAGTDLGRARRQLAMRFAGLCAEVTAGLGGTLVEPVYDASRPVRRDLIRRVIELDPLIDQAIGEDADLSYRSPGLFAALEGLFTTLSGWRMVANHLERLPHDKRRLDTAAVLRAVPLELRSPLVQADALRWTADTPSLRRACAAAVRALVALPADTPSLRLLADGTAEALIGLSRALHGLMLMTDPAQRAIPPRLARLPVPDFLPALVNAARIFVVIGVVGLFWIATGWPSGAIAVIWSALFTLMSPPNADLAYASAKSRLLGVILAAVLAAIIKFAVLPGSENFVGLWIAIGLVLVPAGALSTLYWQAPMFGATASLFIPLLSPQNQLSYDPQQFYNSALAIIAGAGTAALAFRLLPPLSPTFRTYRLLALTLHDLRRLATAPAPPTRSEWESKIYSRLSVLPDQAEPLERAQLLAALSVGSQILRLRRVTHRSQLGADIDAALVSIARGQTGHAIESLGRISQTLVVTPRVKPRASVTLRAQGSIRAISEALAQHALYFDSEAPDELH